MVVTHKSAKTKKLDRSAITSNAGLWYSSVVTGLDAILKGSKPSKKTKLRHEKAVKAVRKFLKQAASEDVAEAGKLDESKKKSGKKTSKKATPAMRKSKDKLKKNERAGKSEKKSQTAAKKPKKLKTSEPIEPLLLTSDDDNVVQLRSPEKLLGKFEADKASDILSLTPQPDVGISNSMDGPKGTKDDLKMIAGVGPKLEELLNGLGVFHFHQIADWQSDDIEWVDNYLQFTGRIDRDNWVEQAIALAKGGRDEYVKVFGKEPR